MTQLRATPIRREPPPPPPVRVPVKRGPRKPSLFVKKKPQGETPLSLGTYRLKQLSAAQFALKDVLAKVGVDRDEVFKRTSSGHFSYEKNRVRLRRLVWRMMRKYTDHVGQPIAYNMIARVCGAKGNSVLIALNPRKPKHDR